MACDAMVLPVPGKPYRLMAIWRWWACVVARPHVLKMCSACFW
ncbi:hypothetical protein [Moraxella lacunata]